jgi:hypothetical protein
MRDVLSGRTVSGWAMRTAAVGFAGLAIVLMAMVAPASAQSAGSGHVSATASGQPGRDDVGTRVYIEPKFLKNAATTRCADHSFEFRLRPLGCNGLDWQKWYRTPWNDDTHEFKNKATGWCLDDSFQYGLRAFPCNQSRYQSWYMQWDSFYRVTLVNQQTGRCLDDSADFGIRTFGCNGTIWQKWWWTR